VVLETTDHKQKVFLLKLIQSIMKLVR